MDIFSHSCDSQYTMTFGADMKTAMERIVVKRTKTTKQSLSMTMAAIFHLAATSLSFWSCFILLEMTRISL